MLSPEAILAQSAHRPWPLPSAPWFMFQQWTDLLFAHWALDPALIRPLIPPELELDLFDNHAWIAITPFRMTTIHLRGLPPIPGTDQFLEMNLRTYVRPNLSADPTARPGVFFLSLDASNLPAVLGARLGFGLPYFWSTMSAQESANEIHYASRRKDSPAEVTVRYAPTTPPTLVKSPLERFLTERYCLYEVRLNTVYRTQIHHLPWPLQQARAHFLTNTLGTPYNLSLSRAPDALHFSKQLDVLVYPPSRADD